MTNNFHFLLVTPEGNLSCRISESKKIRKKKIFLRISLPGFRHYTEYEKWQWNQFNDGIEKTIYFCEYLAECGYSIKNDIAISGNEMVGFEKHAVQVG